VAKAWGQGQLGTEKKTKKSLPRGVAYTIGGDTRVNLRPKVYNHSGLSKKRVQQIKA
jgi:hypothetical protein